MKTFTCTKKIDHTLSYDSPFEYVFQYIDLTEVRGDRSVSWDIPNVPDESYLVYENRETLRLHSMACFLDGPEERRNLAGFILQPTGLAKGQLRRLGTLSIGS